MEKYIDVTPEVTGRLSPKQWLSTRVAPLVGIVGGGMGLLTLSSDFIGFVTATTLSYGFATVMEVTKNKTAFYDAFFENLKKSGIETMDVNPNFATTEASSLAKSYQRKRTLTKTLKGKDGLDYTVSTKDGKLYLHDVTTPEAHNIWKETMDACVQTYGLQEIKTANRLRKDAEKRALAEKAKREYLEVRRVFRSTLGRDTDYQAIEQAIYKIDRLIQEEEEAYISYMDSRYLFHNWHAKDHYMNPYINRYEGKIAEKKANVVALYSKALEKKKATEKTASA